MSNRKIFIDLDDVLVDFTGGLEKFNIQNETAFIHLPKDQWTPMQIRLDKQVIDCMNTPGFFKYLPPKEGCLDLWREAARISPPYILTAWPKTTNDIPRIIEEKRFWVEWYLEGPLEGIHPMGIRDRFICCSREDKSKYARTGDWWEEWVNDDGNYQDFLHLGEENILIDDLPDNIDRWDEAGGIGILYRNAEQAIADLIGVTA